MNQRQHGDEKEEKPVLLHVGRSDRRIEGQSAAKGVKERRRDRQTEDAEHPVHQHAKQPVEERGVETVGKPVDAKNAKEESLDDRGSGPRQRGEVPEGDLAGKNTPAAVENDRLIQRIEAVSAEMETYNRAETHQSEDDCRRAYGAELREHWVKIAWPGGSDGGRRVAGAMKAGE